jgi:hypothetical protein
MPNEASRPPSWRVAAAFAFAPAIAALAFSVLNPMYAGLTDLSVRIWKTFPSVAIVGGYVPTLIFGLPAYLILRTKLRPTVLSCAAVGALVAAFPWALLTLLPVAQEASTGGRPTVVQGHLTWFGLYEGAKLTGQIGLFGCLGGAAFWLISTAGHRSARVSETADRP